jgi:hypothetical protein
MLVNDVDLPLRCACGAWRGVLRGVAPGRGNRCICYCDDCQSFAHYLGRADEILDAHGGTDIFQTSPARLEITAGNERLACVRLRPRSNVVRWFASCCRTPIGNTPAEHRVPLVGVIRSCLDLGAVGLSADAALGPVRGIAFPRFARGDRTQLPKRSLVLHLLRMVGIILAARIRRDQLRSPFMHADGELKASPHVLGVEELRAVEAVRDQR